MSCTISYKLALDINQNDFNVNHFGHTKVGVLSKEIGFGSEQVRFGCKSGTVILSLVDVNIF